MRKYVVKRALSILLVFILCCGTIGPAYALSPEYSSIVTGFWERLLHACVDGASSLPWIGETAGGLVQGIAGLYCEGVCPSSPDAFHYATSIAGDEVQHGSKGDFTYATCTYCHQRFEVYASDLQQSYDTYVEELPGSRVDSSGGFYISRYITDFTGGNFQDTSITPGYTGSFTAISPGDWWCKLCPNVDSVEAPVYGYYTEVVEYVTSGCTFSYGSGRYVRRICSPGDTIPARSSYTYCFEGPRDVRQFCSVSCQVFLYVEPYEPVSSYPVNTRPASITGDYGIIGDNGQITKVDSSTIVNETDKTVYNPVTNTTSNITDWQYDYSTRTYTVTLDNGTTQTITYGDEHITIIEGDTTYNVYYLTSGSDAPSPDTPCSHDWQKGDARIPTCTVPGSATYVCSLCNETKIEAIPALGHNWQIKQTVTTQYDETGQLVQQGYTIFECSVCQEQYKSEDGTVPPGGGSGTDPGGGEGESIWDKLGNLLGTIGNGILSVIEAVAGKLLDGLLSLAEMISQKLTQVVELVLSFFDHIPTLFTGFLDFLTAAFAFLPGDIVLLLTFGIAAVVFIAILKALRR